MFVNYQEEDERFQVKFTSDGILESQERPLVPLESYITRKEHAQFGITAQNLQDKSIIQNSAIASNQEMSVFKEENKSRLSHRSIHTTKSVISNNQERSALTVSKASKGLKQALEAAQAIAKSSENRLNTLMKEAALSYDLRQTIFASFYRVGFDLHDLTSSEKQRMEVIQLYPYLKNGEIWQDIKQELTDLNIRPTGDDRHWLETSIEEAFEQTEKAVHNQGLFAQDVKSKEQDELESYFTTIRLKNQPPNKNGPRRKNKPQKQ